MKKVNSGIIKKLWAFIKPNRKYLILGLIFSAISVIAGLLSTVFIGDGVDYIIGKGNVDFSGLIVVIIKIAVTVGIMFIAEWLTTVFTQKLTYFTVRDIRNLSMETLQKVPLSYIDSKDKGDVLSRVITDVTEVSDGLLLGFTQLFTGLVTIVTTLIIMLVLNWKIGLVVAVLTPLSLFVARYVSRITSGEFKMQSVKRGQLTSLIDEMVGNQKVVKAYSKEEDNQKLFDEINADLCDIGTKATFFSSLTNPTTRFVNNVVYVAVGLIGAMVVMANPVAFTVGRLTAFLMYATKYTKPFNEISGVITELQSAFASARRIFEILEESKETPDKIDAFILDEVKGKVEIQNVDFSYDKNRELIKDFNLKVKPGQRIAIVGPTGCGKTTIINLLMRFYDTDSGEILVEDKSIKNITRNSLRKSYGMVLQETWLKKGTVKENIAYGTPGATDEEIFEAAKKAHAHGFIKRLPKGYDTVIGDEIGGISEGQKQLLCIARIMVRLPNMLILDEATSSIDTRTEIKVKSAFDEMMKGRTSFVVAHRLSTIKNANKILVMNKGKIVEQGTHKELIEKQGFYYELYSSQFAET